MKKARADAKLQNLPEERQAEIWRLLHPEDGGQPLTLEAAAAALPGMVGFGVALSTLSAWRAWFALKRRLEAAADRAEQVKLELAKDPSFTPDDLERAGQTLFTAEAIEEGNVRAFVALVRERNRAKALGVLERRVALLEEKAAEAKAKLEAAATRAKAGGGISEETLMEIEAAAKLL
jgi:hypothetical protein